MATKKKSGASKLAVWIIVGLLMFGMIGFGAAGFNGTQRSLGKVGDKTVSISSYSTTLQNEMAQFQEQIGRNITPQEMQAIGLDQRALNRVISTRALDQLVTDLGLSLGDVRVREQVVEISAFQGLDGKFDREAYAEVLQRNNLKEADFETSLREDAARRILQEAVLTGVTAPEAYAKAMVAYLAETRDFSWARLTQDILISPAPKPSEEDLVTYHSENPAEFTTLAARSVSYIWLTPAMLADDIEIEERELRAAYESRSDEFIQLPSRLVERVIFPSQEMAINAMEAITEEATTFEEVVENRGLTLQDVDLGDVTEAEMGAAGPLVFSLAEPGVIGPAETDLGPALFRVNAILDGNVQSFNSARDQLNLDVALDVASSQIADIAEQVDDLLAGGATLEDVAIETDLQLATFDWHVQSEGGISDYKEFQTAAAAVTAEDFPALGALSDNGIFALRLDGELPAELQPLASVQNAVSESWKAQQIQQQLRTLAERIAPQVSLDAPLTSFGLTENLQDDMNRNDSVDGTPSALVMTAFETELGKAALLDAAEGVIILLPRAIHAANFQDPQVQSLQSILGNRIDRTLERDVFEAFSNAVRESVDVEINQTTLRSVNNNLFGGG
ncbi:MAG: SurA N-terminal domain-containing protein [Planktomarina sp.]|nr:SurA N-terminal domain-containing protein [Planktomarina sp.]